MCLCLQDRSPKTQSQVRQMIEAGQVSQHDRQPSTTSSINPPMQSRGKSTQKTKSRMSKDLLRLYIKYVQMFTRWIIKLPSCAIKITVNTTSGDSGKGERIILIPEFLS